MGSHQVSMHKNLDVFNKRISKTYNAVASAALYVFTYSIFDCALIRCVRKKGVF